MPSTTRGWTSLPPVTRHADEPANTPSSPPARDRQGAPPSPSSSDARFEDDGAGRLTTTVPVSPSAASTTAPAFGGLHQLALRADGPDFSTYRPGKNNRALLGPIVRQLVADYGVFVDHVYGSVLAAGGSDARFGLEATRKNALYDDSGASPDGPAKIHIGEAELDELLAHTDAPLERRALATFVLAHEYFHVYLGHRDLLQGRKVDGVDVKSHRGLALAAERQADHLAARHLLALGLPLEPVERLFTSHQGLAAGNREHPPGAERALVVTKATAGLDEGLFDNVQVACAPRMAQLRYGERYARLTSDAP